MEINGLEIHAGYFVTSAIWIAGVIGMWAAVVAIVSRFVARGGSEAYRRAMKVRLTHVAVIVAMLTVMAVDSAEIFFDGYGYVILGANQILSNAQTNFCIFYLFSHIETYFVTHKTFKVPTWIATTRNIMLGVHLVVGNILFIAHMIVQQSNVQPLVMAFNGITLLLLGSAMLVAVSKIVKALDAFQRKIESSSSNVSGLADEELKRSRRRLKRFGYTSSTIMLLIAVIMLYVFVPRFAEEPITYWEEYGSRSNMEEFSVSARVWLRWINFAACIYIVKLHWIPKTPPKTSTGNSANSGTGFSKPTKNVTSSHEVSNTPRLSSIPHRASLRNTPMVFAAKDDTSSVDIDAIGNSEENNASDNADDNTSTDRHDSVFKDMNSSYGTEC